MMTLSRPVPAKAKTIAAGIDAERGRGYEGCKPDAAKAGTRLTTKNGNTGTSRKKRR